MERDMLYMYLTHNVQQCYKSGTTTVNGVVLWLSKEIEGKEGNYLD
jgi:hypothetical protein